MKTSVISMSTIAALASLPLYTGCGDAPAGGDATFRQVIQPEGFPTNRPYSFGVLTGRTLHLAAQLGQDTSSGEQPEGIEAQTRQAMENLGAVLRAAGLEYANLVKCHVYLDDMDDYTGMNAVYGSFFDARVPARTTVEAEALPRDAGVQIGCVAHADLSAIAVVEPAGGSLPTPLGPYSAAVWAGDTLYLSGMGGQFPEDRRLPEGLGDQVAQTLVNVETTLTAAGLGFDDVVSTHVFLTAPEELDALPAAYDRSFPPSSAPPRGLTVLPRLPGEIKTEITVVAARTTGRRRMLRTGAASAPDAGTGFDDQFRAVLQILEQRLQEAGLGWGDVAHVDVTLADLADLSRMSEIFRGTFPVDPPTRTTIQARPADGALVQASLAATRPE